MKFTALLLASALTLSGCVGVCAEATAGALPVEWATNPVVAKVQAQIDRAPLVVVVCKPGCGICARVKTDVLSTRAFVDAAAVRGWRLAYCETTWPGYMAFTTGYGGALPIISVYKADGTLAGKRFTYAATPATSEGLIALIERALAGGTVAPAPMPTPAPMPAPEPVHWWKRLFGRR